MPQVITDDVRRRVQEQLTNPSIWVERRRDTLVDVTGSHRHWEVEQQVTIPLLQISEDVYEDESSFEAKEDQPYVVSIGFFDRKRHPDLVVRDREGNVLPILDRYTRAQLLVDTLWPIIGRAFKSEGPPEQGAGPTTPPDNPTLVFQTEEDLLAADRVRRLLWNIFLSPAQDARDAAKEVADILEHPRYCVTIERFFGSDFRKEFNNIANALHVFVWIDGRPGKTTHISYNYSEGHTFPSARMAMSAGGDLGARRLWVLLRWFLMELGLLAVPLRMQLSGANHARSYYFMTRAPDGVDVEAYYWHDLRRRDRPPHAHPPEVENIPHESASKTLACHHRERVAELGAGASIDVRLSRPSVALAWLLTAAVCASALVGRENPNSLNSYIPFLAFIPGALIGVLAQRSSALSRRIGRTLQFHLYLLAVLSITYAFSRLGNLVPNNSPFDLGDERLNRWLLFLGVWTLSLLSFILILASVKVRARDDVYPVYLSYRHIRNHRYFMRVAAVAGFGVSLIAALWVSGIDRSISDTAADIPSRSIREAVDKFDYVSSAEVVAIVASAICLMLMTLPGRRKQGYAVLLGYIFAAAATVGLKILIDRDRPAIALELPDLLFDREPALPSGHAMAATYIVLWIVALMTQILLPKRTRVLGIIGLLIVTLVAVERVYTGKHWLSDVVAGVGIGMLGFLLSERWSRTADGWSRGVVVKSAGSIRRAFSRSTSEIETAPRVAAEME